MKEQKNNVLSLFVALKYKKICKIRKYADLLHLCLFSMILPLPADFQPFGTLNLYRGIPLICNKNSEKWKGGRHSGILNLGMPGIKMKIHRIFQVAILWGIFTQNLFINRKSHMFSLHATKVRSSTFFYIVPERLFWGF